MIIWMCKVVFRHYFHVDFHNEFLMTFPDNFNGSLLIFMIIIVKTNSMMNIIRFIHKVSLSMIN